MLFRINALLLAAWVALAPIATADASQNALFSPTTGTVSGLSLTNSYNSALDSLNTLNSGATAPTNQLSGSPSAGNSWLNTSANPNNWGLYDGLQWVRLGALDTTNHIWDGQVGGGTASIASSSGSGVPDLCSVPQYFITLTGTTTITGFGSTCAAGVQKVVTFAAALTLTYNSGSLIIPGAANVTTSAGDIAILVALGSGNWQVISYAPANGAALINPAVDVGTFSFFGGGAPPSGKYLEGYGQAISRTTYATLLGVYTNTQSVTRTSGSPTLTGFSDTTKFAAGQAVEGSGISPGSTIVSTTSTTVTLSANAISSGSGNVTVFYYGNGDGSTTFNLPDCRGQLLVGRNNMGGTGSSRLNSTYALANPNAMGVSLGSQNHTQTTTEMPSHSHSVFLNDPGHAHGLPFTPIVTGGGLNIPSGGGVGPGATSTNSNTTGMTIWSGAGGTGTQNATAAQGTGNPFSVVNPMLTVECTVRVLP